MALTQAAGFIDTRALNAKKIPFGRLMKVWDDDDVEHAVNELKDWARQMQKSNKIYALSLEELHNEWQNKLDEVFTAFK